MSVKKELFLLCVLLHGVVKPVVPGLEYGLTFAGVSLGVMCCVVACICDAQNKERASQQEGQNSTELQTIGFQPSEESPPPVYRETEFDELARQ